MKPVELVKGIYSVGVSDWNIRNFHGYSTDMGTTYNAYLIVDEKVALIDTVKLEFVDQLIENISQIIDPKKIDVMISNHTEMDHSGGLPRIMHKIGENKPLYCSKMGLKNLSNHFTQQWDFRAVKSGDDLSLGGKNLTFLETRMLHWPDSMFTYLKEDKILFSSDAFGQHYAGPEKFDDEIGDNIMPHAKKYFANILLLYTTNILKLVETVTNLGLEFNMICPDHGIIWRKDPGKIVEAYVKWSEQKSEKKAIVVYDTMWHSTEKMAEAITEGISEQDVHVMPMSLQHWNRSDVMTEVMDAKAIVVGSPTLNNNMLPTVIDFLTYMKGLKPKNKLGAAFGSYGWSGESAVHIEKELQAMKFEIVAPPMKIQYVPDPDRLKDCYELGKTVGQKVAAM
ncbi:MAG: flavodoxin domain-containing protein [Deltaproteobacteria bacterium]|nr:flavodoxin domain-containing protein [Deltaproteobacteria bacterium]